MWVCTEPSKSVPKGTRDALGCHPSNSQPGLNKFPNQEIINSWLLSYYKWQREKQGTWSQMTQQHSALYLRPRSGGPWPLGWPAVSSSSSSSCEKVTIPVNQRQTPTSAQSLFLPEERVILTTAQHHFLLLHMNSQFVLSFYFNF